MDMDTGIQAEVKDGDGLIQDKIHVTIVLLLQEEEFVIQIFIVNIGMGGQDHIQREGQLFATRIVA
tara:strand:+ start:80 stop:277 length:198 start_codon:yes stop_codon:yes gene_type:complete